MMLKQRSRPANAPSAHGKSGKHRSERTKSTENQKPITGELKTTSFRRIRKKKANRIEERSAKKKRDGKMRCGAMRLRPENRAYHHHSYLRAANGLTQAALRDGQSANKTFNIPAAAKASAALLKSKTKGNPGEFVMIHDSGHEIANPKPQPRTASVVLSNRT